jgi:hypothetical protein
MSTVSRQEILDLLAAGKINAAEAAELLNNASTEPEVTDKEELLKAEFDAEPDIKIVDPMPTKKPSNSRKGSWFRVRVKNLETGKNKVTVNIPMPMVKFGLKIGRQFSSDLNELNLDEMYAAIGESEQGMIVDVQDEESNEHVQVFID